MAFAFAMTSARVTSGRQSGVSRSDASSIRAPAKSCTVLSRNEGCLRSFSTRVRSGCTAEVSLIEIGNAMAVVVAQTGGIEAEELKREALGMFGGKRMTAGIEARLGEALEVASGQGGGVGARG